MTRCPTCDRRYAADARFCAVDGTALVSVEATPAEAAPADGGAPGLPPSGGSASPVPASRALGDLLARMDTPSASGGELPPAVEPLGAPAGPYAPAPGVPADVPPEAPARRSGAWKVGLAVLAALVLGAVAGYATLGGARPLEREALDAIARGDLVTPTRVSARDFADRLAAQHPNSAALRRVGEAAFPRLIAEMDGFYTRFYRTSEATDAEWQKTARLAEWAAAIAPDDGHVRARAEYAAARVAAIDGDRQDARAGYERAAAAWPEWALPPNSLGVLLVQARDFDGAEDRYREAAALDPAWPFPPANLGGLYLRQERYDAAEEVLDRAVSADPARPYPHAMLARAYAGQDRYDEAIEAASEALRLDPTGAAGFDARRLRADAERWRAERDAEDDFDPIEEMKDMFDGMMSDSTAM